MVKKEKFQQMLESAMNKQMPAKIFASLAPPTLTAEALAKWKKSKK
jgi:hypothetical protein